MLYMQPGQFHHDKRGLYRFRKIGKDGMHSAVGANTVLDHKLI